MQSPRLTNNLDSRGVVELAFSARPDLQGRVQQTLSHDSSGLLQPLLGDIAHYVLELRRASGTADGDGQGPDTKRRKLNNGTSAGDKGAMDGASALNGNWTGTPFGGVSFAVPQRKKLSLLVSAARNEGIKAINPATNAAEFGVTWRQAEHVLCLPVPEKAQAAKNFCVLPKGATNGDADGHGFEPIVWTASDAKGRGDPEDALTASESMIQALKAAKASVVEPSDKEFASQIKQALRKGEKAYHVKAFKGNKDGYLFFLPTGIFWGFKKPLHFFAFADVESISYTSVLQRTFNLVVAALPATGAAAAGPPPAEHEFAMLDQADFAGIDQYVRRHGLSDASMAAARKAKRLNVNGAKGEALAEAGEEEEDESELKKAEREAEMKADDDDDEEDDENFDPGSEGESEGSGSSDDEDEGDENTGGKEGDLVAEELGSEAEEVEDDDDEGEDPDDET